MVDLLRTKLKRPHIKAEFMLDVVGLERSVERDCDLIPVTSS